MPDIQLQIRGLVLFSELDYPSSLVVALFILVILLCTSSITFAVPNRREWCLNTQCSILYGLGCLFLICVALWIVPISTLQEQWQQNEILIFSSNFCFCYCYLSCPRNNSRTASSSIIIVFIRTDGIILPQIHIWIVEIGREEEEEEKESNGINNFRNILYWGAVTIVPKRPLCNHIDNIKSIRFDLLVSNSVVFILTA